MITTEQLSLLEAIPDCAAIVSADGTLVAVNRAWRQFANENEGDNEGYYVGSNYFDVCSVEDDAPGAEAANEAIDLLKAVLNGTHEAHFTYPCHSPSKNRWFEAIFTPIKVNDSRGALIMHRNVSSQVRNHDLVRGPEPTPDILSAIIATLPDPIIGIDLNGNIFHWNRAAEDFYGYTAEEAIGKSMEILYPPNWPVRIHEYVADVIAGDLHRFEVVRVAKSGERRTVSISAAPVRDQDGHIVGISNLHRDVTDLRSAERELRFREATYRTAVLVGELSTWETIFDEWESDSASGTRLWPIEAMERLGIDLPDGRGRVGGEEDELAAIMHPEDRHKLAGFYETMREEDDFAAEYRIVQPDGSVRYLEGRGRVTERHTDERPRRLISVQRDVTERVERDMQLNLTLNELNHRTKNLLTVIQAIARRTFEMAENPQASVDTYSERLHGIAISHDLLVKGAWSGASLKELVTAHLEPFGLSKTDSVVISGPEVVLNAAGAQSLGLALHELATNSLKHGFLSGVPGELTIVWKIVDGEDGNPSLEFTWHERFDEKVEIGTREGFGNELLRRLVAATVDGSSDYRLEEHGVRWKLHTSDRVLAGGGALEDTEPPLNEEADLS